MRRPRSKLEAIASVERPGVSLAWMLLGAGAFAVIVVIVIGLFGSAGRRGVNERPIGIDAIAAAPDAYDGKTVTIAGAVTKIYGPQMFALDGHPVGAGPDLLVLVKDPMAAQVALDDAIVTVTGTVRRFTARELRRDYEWIDERWLDDRDWSAAARLPVLVADSAASG